MVLASFFGCASSKLVFLKYDVPMIKVERPIDVKKKYGEIDTVKLTSDNRYFFSDSLIDAIFVYSPLGIEFSILNKSDQSMKLIWDEAGLIEPDNSLTRVMHNGVKYSERNNSMPASVIPRRGKIEDQATPVSRIYYREGVYSQYYSMPGGWENSGIFPWYTKLTNADLSPITVNDMNAYRDRSRRYIGSKIGLLLPLQVQDIKNEYTFWFEVKNVELDTASDKNSEPTAKETPTESYY
jgi:hypothetical protein